MLNWSQGLLNDDELKAIGCVAVESALFEYLIDDHIFDVCEFDTRIGHMVAGMMFIDKKLDFLRDAITPLLRDDAALKKRFAEVFAESKDAIADRNTVIHGLWIAENMTFTRENGIVTGITVTGPKKSLKFSRGSRNARVLPADRVLAVAQRLSQCMHNLGKVLAECTDRDSLRQNRAARQSRMGAR